MSNLKGSYYTSMFSKENDIINIIHLLHDKIVEETKSQQYTGDILLLEFLFAN